MAVQDEDRVALDALSKAPLKAWIEDWLQLNAPATIIQQITTAAPAPTPQAEDDGRFFGGVQIPKWRGWTTAVADRNFTVAEVVFVRFSLLVDTTVSGARFVTDSGVNAADAWDVGIYDATGATKLASSGVVTNPAKVGNYIELPFTSNVVLAATTMYTAALIQTANGGGANNYSVANMSNILVKYYGNTIQTWLSGTVSNGGTPYAALPADLTVGAAPAASGGAGPFLILTTP